MDVETEKGVLVRYTFSILPDGRLLTEIDGIDSKDWLSLDLEDNPNTHIIASAMRFIHRELITLDTKLQKFIGGV